MKKKKTFWREIGTAVGFCIYRLLEICDGERCNNFCILSYRKAQPLKILALGLINSDEEVDQGFKLNFQQEVWNGV